MTGSLSKGLSALERLDLRGVVDEGRDSKGVPLIKGVAFWQ
jgi:hypothetical protein